MSLCFEAKPPLARMQRYRRCVLCMTPALECACALERPERATDPRNGGTGQIAGSTGRRPSYTSFRIKNGLIASEWIWTDYSVRSSVNLDLLALQKRRLRTCLGRRGRDGVQQPVDGRTRGVPSSQLFTEGATVESYTGGRPGSSLKGRKQIGDTFAAFVTNFETVYQMNGQQAR